MTMDRSLRYKVVLGLAVLGALSLTAAFAFYLYLPYLILNPPPPSAGILAGLAFVGPVLLTLLFWLPGLALLLIAYLTSIGIRSRLLGLLFKYAAILHLLASVAVALSVAADVVQKIREIQLAAGGAGERGVIPAMPSLESLLRFLLAFAGIPAVAALLLWIAAARRSEGVD